MALVRNPCSPPKGHWWDEVPSDWDPPFGLTPITFRCQLCGSERRWGIDLRGDITYARYVRTEGWVSWAKGERPRTQDFRLDWVERHITEARKRRRRRNGPKAVNDG